MEYAGYLKFLLALVFVLCLTVGHIRAENTKLFGVVVPEYKSSGLTVTQSLVDLGRRYGLQFGFLVASNGPFDDPPVTIVAREKDTSRTSS